MVSCTCQRSVYSQLPFDQCTPENGGCRVCPAGQYQVIYCLSVVRLRRTVTWDVGGPWASPLRALRLGVPPGLHFIHLPLMRYAHDANCIRLAAAPEYGGRTKCGDLEPLPERGRRRPVHRLRPLPAAPRHVTGTPYSVCGCSVVAPITAGQVSMAYVSGCAFSCKSPALVTSASSPGYYCSAPLVGAVCPDLCLRCACPPPDTTCSQPPADGAGLYWGSCVDVLGIRPMECDSSQLPPGAVFVGNAGRSACRV